MPFTHARGARDDAHNAGDMFERVKSAPQFELKGSAGNTRKRGESVITHKTYKKSRERETRVNISGVRRLPRERRGLC